MTEKLIRDALVLLATIDPVGSMALFAALTRHLDVASRRRTAVKAIVYAGIILVVCVVIGQLVLAGMGISLVSFQIAGGVILFAFGMQMVLGTGIAGDQPAKEPGHDIAVFPLAVPSIATPGAILAVILLTDNHLYTIPTQAATTAVLVSVLAITLGLMLGASAVLRIIGQNGASILVRVMGMILAALSVELIADALDLPQLLQPMESA